MSTNEVFTTKLVTKKEFPPNYEEICSKLRVRGRKSVVFTYGKYLYNPSGNPISFDLIRHEEVHVKQQAKMGVKEWWTKYLEDRQFRFEQEIEAYKAQYAYIKANYNRDQRRALLQILAKDLSGSIYGNLTTKRNAENLITDEDITPEN